MAEGRITILGKSKVWTGKYLSVWRIFFLDKKGEERQWESVERKDGLFIFPITPDKKIVLVKNFRVPLGKYVIELPAGLKDKEGESDIETATRELLEETGYAAEKFIPIFNWPSNSGITDSVSKGIVATGLKKIQDSHGDDTEEIEVIEIDFERMIEFASECMSQGVLFNVGVLGLYLLVDDLIKKGAITY